VNAARAPRRVSLHQRLLVITVASAAAVLLGVALLMFASGRMRADLNRATKAVLEEQEIADRVIDGVMRQLVTITAATDEGLEPMRPEFEAAGVQVYEGLRAYLFRDLTLEERLQIEEVKEEHQLLEVTALRASENGSLRDSASRIALRREAMNHALSLLEAMNGFLRLREIDLSDIAAEQSRSFRVLWLGGGVSLLALGAMIGLLLTRFLRRRVVAPLTTLADAVTRFGEGELDARVPTAMDREFQDLAVAFNLMSERLMAAQGALATRNNDLEEALQHVREARDELVQSEKLGAVGRMSAGLAHELNNPLAAVLGYAELLAAELHDGTPMSPEIAMSHVEPLVREATRARQLVRSLLQFSRRAGDEVGPVSLREAMTVVTDLRCGSFEQSGLRLVVDPLPDQAVLAEAQRLQGVFLNIVNNAHHAMRSQGHGTLRVHHEVHGDRIHLFFDDDGPGLSQPDRVFEPFFTTKEPGEGTGLGLALAQRFVDSFGGEIRAENRADGGARFTVVLRLADGAAPVTVAASPAPSSDEIDRRLVLVVDDEPDLRRLAGKVLRRLGVEVVEAGTAAAAREVLQQRNVHVVVSDVRMPGESGVALFRWIEQEQPELAGRFLFVTGDADAQELGNIPDEHPHALLLKPFTLSDLTERVLGMLARSASGR
jgi:C4-dicarboxylate-specific signal transduction histidine kinase